MGFICHPYKTSPSKNNRRDACENCRHSTPSATKIVPTNANQCSNQYPHKYQDWSSHSNKNCPSRKSFPDQNTSDLADNSADRNPCKQRQPENGSVLFTGWGYPPCSGNSFWRSEFLHYLAAGYSQHWFAKSQPVVGHSKGISRNRSGRDFDAG